MPQKIKPWSISTTVRNPERLRGFLSIASEMEGRVWKEAQEEFQVRLIQNRLYGFANAQFYSDLSEGSKTLIESGKDISLEEAEKIFKEKNYEDPPMRGRTSLKPLEKFGFASVQDGYLKITDSGHALLKEKSDLGEIFLRCLLKWQLPNPLDRGFPTKFGYNIKPFTGILHLIREVNRLCEKKKEKAKGISLWEFRVFALTLIDYKKIQGTAQKIIHFRDELNKIAPKNWEKQKEKERKKISSHFEIKHLEDYSDNALRYFRLTRLIRLRGEGRYIDLEPLRETEINALLDSDTGDAENFSDKDGYFKKLSDPTQPSFPWETPEHRRASAQIITQNIRELGGEIESLPDFKAMKAKEGAKYIENLRQRALDLKTNQDKQKMQSPDEIRQIIDTLTNMLNRKTDIVNKPIVLEHMATLGMIALNDAIKIQPNYPCGDDNMPTHTAPAGKPDIECHYEGFSAICEVTMLRTRDQWVHEGQPVLRHLHEFDHDKKRDSFCVFIAPIIHQDTANTFLFAIKDGYENKSRRIAPMTIPQFCDVLTVCAQRRENNQPLRRDEISTLLSSIVNKTSELNSGQEWIKSIPEIISSWRNNLEANL